MYGELQAGRLINKDAVVGYFILGDGFTSTFSSEEDWSAAISMYVMAGMRVCVSNTIDVEGAPWATIR